MNWTQGQGGPGFAELKEKWYKQFTKLSCLEVKAWHQEQTLCVHTCVCVCASECVCMCGTCCSALDPGLGQNTRIWREGPWMMLVDTLPSQPLPVHTQDLPSWGTVSLRRRQWELPIAVLCKLEYYPLKGWEHSFRACVDKLLLIK